MVFKNERMEDGKWRTVDQKRDVALQMVGDMLYDPVEFRLGFEGETIRFKAFQDIKQLENAWAIELFKSFPLNTNLLASVNSLKNSLLLIFRELCTDNVFVFEKIMSSLTIL